MGAGGLDQLGVAAEAERDAVGDLEARLFAGDLDGVDDLAGEALAAQLLVELELQGDGVARLGLDLVTLQRLQREGQLVGPEGVIVAVDAIPISPPSARAAATWAGSSASTAAATCGIRLPKRGPRLR